MHDNSTVDYVPESGESVATRIDRCLVVGRIVGEQATVFSHVYDTVEVVHLDLRPMAWPAARLSKEDQCEGAHFARILSGHARGGL